MISTSDIDSIRLLANRYCIEYKIGEGGFGEVYKARDIRTGDTVAIKVFNNVFRDCIDTKRTLREIYLLQCFNHKNIIKIRDLFSTSNVYSFKEIYLVLDYMPFDLRTFLNSNKIIHMEVILKIFVQISEALLYLRKMKIIHRDLKPSNILLDENYNVKLCDFGLARGLHTMNLQKKMKIFPKVSNICYTLPPNLSKPKSSIKEIGKETLNELPTIKKSIITKKKSKDFQMKLQKGLSHHIGTRWYRSPETILLNTNYDYQSDIWGLGCVFSELLSMRSQDSLKGPLFPGDFCYPLSPLQQKNLKDSIINPFDQLNMILEIIGTPSEEDLLFIENPSAKDYIKNFPKKHPVDFRKLFPCVDLRLLSLLKKLLEFNPNKRITIMQILDNEIFNGIRDKNEIEMELENDDNACRIDFETDNFFLDRKDLMHLFLREFNKFREVNKMEKTELHLEILLNAINHN